MKVFSAIFVVVLLLVLNGNLLALDRPESARIYKAMADIRALEAAINSFNADIGRYPETNEGLTVLVEPTSEFPDSENYKDGGYLHRIPYDPWGNEYQYQYPGIHNITTFDVWTFGSDGKAGGSGYAEDAGNWPGAFEKMQALERRNDFLNRVGITALVGFIVGIPLYIVGTVIKFRNGSPFQAAFLGLHLGVQIYLTLIGPLIVALLMIASNSFV